MTKLPTMEELAKAVAQKALQEIKINNVPLCEFVETVNNAIDDSTCHLASCRYNDINCKCISEEKRKECVEVSRKVMCLDELP